MWLEKALDHPLTVRRVVANMREWDRREIFATRLDESDDGLLREIAASGPVSWVAGKERPIAAFGCSPMWPGVWSMWFFATDEIHQIGISVTKLVTRYIVPMLYEAGAHRLECRSMEGHHDAQRWLEVIGASREGTLHGYGKSGEDFHVYVWRRP